MPIRGGGTNVLDDIDKIDYTFWPYHIFVWHDQQKYW